MLLPVENASITIAAGIVGSALERMEQKRAEEKQAEKEERGQKNAFVLPDDATKKAEENVSEYFLDAQTDSRQAIIKLAERVTEVLGLTEEQASSHFAIGRQLQNLVQDMGSKALAKLEEQLGLDALGVSAEELATALIDPGSIEAEKIGLAASKAGASPSSGMSAQDSKVIERLEEVANPKSIEELKLEQAEETDEAEWLERDEKIRSLETLDALEETKDMIDEFNSETAASAEIHSDGNADRPVVTSVSGMLAAAADAAAEAAENASSGTDDEEAPIAAVFVDENGIYALLAEKQREKEDAAAA